MRNAVVDHGVMHLGPCHFVIFFEVPDAPFRFIHLDALSLVDVHETAMVPGMKVVGFDEVELGQAHFFHAHHHAFIELRIGSRAPVFCVGARPVADAGDIGLEDHTVRDGYAGRPVHRHKNLTREFQPFLTLRFFMQLFGDSSAADEHRFGILLDERMKSKEGLRFFRGGLCAEGQRSSGCGEQKITSRSVQNEKPPCAYILSESAAVHTGDRRAIKFGVERTMLRSVWSRLQLRKTTIFG